MPPLQITRHTLQIIRPTLQNHAHETRNRPPAARVGCCVPAVCVVFLHRAAQLPSREQARASDRRSVRCYLCARSGGCARHRR
eukprot:1908992-Rhodomonas_salina.1